MDETTVALGTTSTDGTAQTAATEATTTSTTTTTTTQTGSLPGDVDADGKVGVSDVIMMQKYLLGLGKLTDPAQADLHKDGVIDIFDLAMLKHIALNH
ncbi:MAG: dockerin type I repeat-containing protein [Oscillospiraceae bacterium]|nr:dockerin type I repeat-containing protein [Oscillospiraceae bacterium]